MTRLVLIAAVMMLMPGMAAAIRLEPGTWEVTVTSQNPLTGEPVEKTLMECIRDASFDPAGAMVDGSQCTITEIENTDSVFRWTMACGGGDMPAFYGEGVFESRGRSASGSMTMTMNYAGNTLKMSNHWQGRYISSTCK